jgi:hypothetical protein
VVARVKDATEAIPGKLKVGVRLYTVTDCRNWNGELTVVVAVGSLHVEKDSSSFSHAFSEDPWTAMLEVELALRDWLGRNNVSGQVLLEGFTVSELDICCVQTRHMFSFGRHLGDGKKGTLRIVGAKVRWRKSISQHA